MRNTLIYTLCFTSLLSWLSSCSLKVHKMEKYIKVWSDEFDYTGRPDSTKWSYDLGDGCPNNCSWGNNEAQYYTENSKNARVSNGKLIIEAHQENMGTKKFTSCRLVSKHKGDWLYGKIEVRAKLPSGRGVWPAIWMLPTEWAYGGWPSSGEIDIMEFVGFTPDTIFATIHTKDYNHVKGTQVSKGIYLDDASSVFHNYRLEWDENQMSVFCDEIKILQYNNDHKGFASWPYDKKFHLLLNIAVGGHWGGKKGIDPNIWPQKMEIDYVRVFQKSGQQ